jgi:hypothetical protein
MLERDILIANEWNLNLSNGFDILNLLLTFSNDSYNFKPILMTVGQLAQEDLLLKKRFTRSGYTKTPR